MSLSFVNQVGAVRGMNQAAPGSFISEEFVRWSQDVLFDRVGQLRRRAPYLTVPLYNEIGTAFAQPNEDDQRVIGVINTRNFDNENVIGIIVTDGTTTRVLFYDSDFRKTCYCDISNVRSDTIVFSRPALNGGLFIGLLENYGTASGSNKNLLYYWRGATGEGGYTLNSCTIGVTNNPEVTGSLVLSNDKITVNNHGYPNGYPITFTDLGNVTGPVTLGTVYYVVNSATNDFQIAASPGDTHIEFTGADSTVKFTIGGHTTYTDTINAQALTTGTVDVSTNIITKADHNYNNNDAIIFTSLGTVTGIDTNNKYYVQDVTTNTFTVSLTKNGTAIDLTGVNDTVSFKSIFDTDNLSKGMFVYRLAGGNDERYLGVVKAWAADGSYITLEKDAIRTYGYQSIAEVNTAANVKFVNIRPYVHNHGRGLITKTEHGLTVTSGTIGTEGEGHFASADLAGTQSLINWALYRSSDGEWLGDVASVTNNAALSLDSVYHTNIIAMNADEYVARPYTSISESNDPTSYTGVFNTTYAGYQWYANNGTLGAENRIVFSSYHNPESVDLSRDAADSIIIPGTQQMRGIATSSSGLLIFLEDKTYLLRGNYRSNFSLEELYPEGCLSAQSIVEYGGGVFWAAKNGILFYDGATVINLTESNFGSYYTDSIKSFDANNRRIYGFFYKDYLFMTFTGFTSNYTPLRYEPVYSDGVSTTDAIADFNADDWDPDFTLEDFKIENNVPIYWKSYKMYSSEGSSDQNFVGKWSEGKSYPNATVTAGSATITGLSDLTATDVGKYVIGYGIPEGATVVSQATTSMVISAVATESSSLVSTPRSSVQILPNVPTNTWNKSIQFVWGPVNFIESMTFAIYLPTNAITAISNFDFRGFIKLDSSGGTKGYAGINAINPTVKVIRKSLTSNVATLTLVNHTIPVGGTVKVSGVDDTFDGEHVVTSVTNTTISYSLVSSNVSITNSFGEVSLVGTYARLIDVDSMLQPNNTYSTTLDSELSENLGKQASLYYKGPDFYLQTKHYTVGDPVLKKWFRQVMLNLYLLDGGMRMDVIDLEDNDRIDVQKKRHRNWETFEESTYTWNELETITLPKLLSPNRSNWNNVEGQSISWYRLTDSEFTRRKKKISWRYPSAGFRLYQMNAYRPANYREPKRPHTVVVDSWNIGFKPMRVSRV